MHRVKDDIIDMTTLLDFMSQWSDDNMPDCMQLCFKITSVICSLWHGLHHYSGQLSLLPSAGRKMSTGQSVVMLCGLGVKAGMVYSTCG